MFSFYYYSVFRQRSGRGGVLGWSVADNDAAVGDTGAIPAFPELGVLAPMLEKDMADAWRVIREGVGDLGRREGVTTERHGEERGGKHKICHGQEKRPMLQNNCSLTARPWEK